MRTNNTIISLATLLAMVLVSSCTKTDIESELESTKSQLLYVTADIAKDAASRVSMEAVTDGESTTINLAWENTGETFDVIDANNNVVAKFKQTDDTTDEPNKFVGKLTNAAGNTLLYILRQMLLTYLSKTERSTIARLECAAHIRAH